MIRTALITVFFALGLGHAAAAGPVLKSEVVVTGPIVTVGDMFADAGALAEQALFRAPAPGTTGIVDLEAVRRATAIVGLAEFEHQDVVRVRVSRAATVIDELALTTMIVNDLVARGIVEGGVTAETRFDTPGLTFNAEAVETPAALTTLRYLPGTGAFTARFVIAGHDQPIDVTGMIELMIETPHLVTAMRAGEILGPQDIEMRTVPLKQAETFGIATPADLIGKALMRQSRAGLMLRASDVTEPELIQRNEAVTVYYRSGALTLTVKGQSLGGAVLGQPVSVLNLMTRRVLTAVAIADGAVEIVVPRHVAGL